MPPEGLMPPDPPDLNGGDKDKDKEKTHLIVIKECNSTNIAADKYLASISPEERIAFYREIFLGKAEIYDDEGSLKEFEKLTLACFNGWWLERKEDCPDIVSYECKLARYVAELYFQIPASKPFCAEPHGSQNLPTLIDVKIAMFKKMLLGWIPNPPKQFPACRAHAHFIAHAFNGVQMWTMDAKRLISKQEKDKMGALLKDHIDRHFSGENERELKEMLGDKNFGGDFGNLLVLALARRMQPEEIRKQEVYSRLFNGMDVLGLSVVEIDMLHVDIMRDYENILKARLDKPQGGPSVEFDFSRITKPFFT